MAAVTISTNVVSENAQMRPLTVLGARRPTSVSLAESKVSVGGSLQGEPHSCLPRLPEGPACLFSPDPSLSLLQSRLPPLRTPVGTFEEQAIQEALSTSKS